MKGHKARNVLVVVGTNVPGKGWTLPVAVGTLGDTGYHQP